MSNVSVGQFGLLQVDDTSDILHQCCFVSGCLCHGLQMVYIRYLHQSNLLHALFVRLSKLQHLDAAENALPLAQLTFPQ